MKKLNYYFPIVLISMIIFGLVSCQQENRVEDLSDATISIERIGNPDTNLITVKFSPSENAQAFEYAIGLPDEENLFLEGSIDVVRVEGNDSLEVTFDGLDPDTEYAVFARAYNGSNMPGGLARMDIFTKTDKYKISTYFLTNNSVSIKFEYSPRYTNFRYYLGKKEDREAFVNSKTDDDVLIDVYGYYYVSYFGIEPGEYVFYAQGEDLSGVKTEIIEIDFTTPEYNDIPCAELKVVSQDIFRSKFELVPNEKCGKISAVVNFKGYFDANIYGPESWMGDHITTLSNWETLGTMYGYNGCFAIGEPLVFSFDDVQFVNTAQIEIIALFWDKDMNPTGVQRFVVDKNFDNPDAPEATVSVSVGDITTVGATYTYTPDNNTIGFLYDTLDADWYDDFKETPEWTEFYIHELLLSNGMYWCYCPDMKSDVVTFTENTGEAGKRYYAAACPMNENGTKGWGPLALTDYVTNAE